MLTPFSLTYNCQQFRQSVGGLSPRTFGFIQEPVDLALAALARGVLRIFPLSPVCIQWAGIAHSVKRPATGWTVRRSNPGGGRDFPHSSRPALGSAQPPIQWVTDYFPGVKRPGCGVDHPPHLASRLKKE